MSRLDEHVALVRFKLTLATFVRTLPLAGTILAAVLFSVIVAEHLTEWALPRPQLWFWISMGITIAASLVFAIVRRPTAHQAAVAIDERLELKEKFSTALYVRSSNDPFAAAAVRDAEQAATSANLSDKFPIAFPARWTARLILAAIVAACTLKLPHYHPEAKPDQAKVMPPRQITRPAAEQLARAAIAEAEAAPREVMEDEHVKMAMGEVQKNLDQHAADPARTQQKAQDLLKDLAAIKQKIAETNKFVTETNEMNALKDISAPSPDELGPVADAQRALSEGKVDDAVQDLKQTVDNFDKMDKKDQEKAAEQMQQLAQQVAQKANDPKVQQEVQKQLQEAGVDKKTAENMTQKMKDAANGDKQAQQQLQQMANQAAQQANQQKGMSPQQQQAVANAIKSAVQNGQQKTNGQQNAQQMAQSAQALAQAMKQAAQQPQQAQGKQGQGNQGQAQAQAKQNQGQQAQGQTAQQAMQQQMGQLAAMAKDAQGVAAAQAAQAQAGQASHGQQQGQPSGQWGQGQQGQGQGNQGNPQQGGPAGGQGFAQGAAGGRRPDPTIAPFGTKTEYSESQTIDDGRIIANSFVKAPTVVGSSKVTLSKAIDSETKEDAGEVESDRIPRSAQKAVRDYFDTLKQDQK